MSYFPHVGEVLGVADIYYVASEQFGLGGFPNYKAKEYSFPKGVHTSRALSTTHIQTII